MHGPCILVASVLLHACAVASSSFGEPCSQANNHLQVGTYQFSGDCDATTYCASNGSCAHKGCRKDIFPFGFPKDVVLPPLCPPGQFCPDEGSACLDLLTVGSPCQFDRDDQCKPPPNFKELQDLKYGLNVNGSICLNFQCTWANKSVNSPCTVENTAYIVYGPNNQEGINIISRDDCAVGSYCDSQKLVCIRQKGFGISCEADKECLSLNCLDKQTCGNYIDAATHVSVGVYVIVGIGIFGGMIGTLTGLSIFHGKQREKEREKRLQYWREQNAFRQNIMQMRDAARASLLSIPLGIQTLPSDSVQSALHGRDVLSSEDSQSPILQQPGIRRGSRRKYGDGHHDKDTGVRYRS